MSFFKNLFGGGRGDGSPSPHPEEVYEGYRIHVTPIPEGNQFRLAATIEKEIDGELRHYKLIRADVMPTKGDIAEAALRKARQLIDSQGDKIFE